MISYAYDLQHEWFETCIISTWMHIYTRKFRYVYLFSYVYIQHEWLKMDTCIKTRTSCKSNTLLYHVIKVMRIKSYTYENGHVWNKNFYGSLNIHVWNLSCNFWCVYHFIHETFDTCLILYMQLLIRVCFLTCNFLYVEPLGLFVHFGQH